VRDVTFSGAVATAYAAHRRGYPEPVVDLLVKTLGLPRSAFVLDLGCGTGQLTVPLARHFSRVVGADPSADMLALARSGSPDAPAAWLLAGDADVARLPLLAGLDAVTIAQAIHLLDRPLLFRSLATSMSPRGRIAIIANGSPLWLRELDWSRALRAYLEEWLGAPVSSSCGTDAASRAGFRAELAAAGFPAAVEVSYDYTESHSLGRIAGNVCSALSPAQLPSSSSSFEDGLRAALGPGPFAEDVRVSILVAGRGDGPRR
jgi:SAM-dependent methyltransferase